MSAERGWLPDFLYRDGKLEGGVAMFAGKSGRITRFSSAPQDLESAVRLRSRVVLPGLVNTHSHAFQRTIRGRTECRTGAGHDNFWTWREAMYHAAVQLLPEEIYAAARMAFLEMLAAGITTVGEFHYLHYQEDGTRYDNPNLLAELVAHAAADVGLRIALLRTAYVRAGWKRPPNAAQERFITPDVRDFIADTELLRARLASDSAWVGVAPHSVRAVPLDYLLEVVNYARQTGMKVHMHASEQPAEIEACLDEHGLRPLELLDQHGVLDGQFTAVHAIHVTPEEIAALARSQAKVCACPTTERNLGDGIAPAGQWTAAGVGTCLGSDSNVQIDLLEDARELEYHLRLKCLERAVLAPDANQESLATRLLTAATQAGAESLGAPGGSLEPGRAADFFTVDLSHRSIAGADASSLLSNIVFSAEPAAIREVYVGGTQVITDGRHAQEDDIIRRFTAVQHRLWNGGA
jgi:formimidoylglutamate deiminase